MSIAYKKPQTFNAEDRGNVLLFVYATLKNKRVQEHVLKHTLRDEKITVDGYKKVSYTTDEGHDFNTLEKDPVSSTKGNLLHITAEDLKKLRSWEDQYRITPLLLRDGRHACYFKLAEEFIKHKDTK